MKPIICVKIGGKPAEDNILVKSLLLEICDLSGDYQFFLVHGGGKEISRISRMFGHEPQFKDGIRITSEQEMEIVEMTLSGKVNKALVRLAIQCGLKAAGFSGCDSGLLQAEALSSDTSTGKITKTGPGLINDLFEKNYFPVISPIASGPRGEALNINADEAALELSAALKAEALIYVSDISGVIIGGSQIAELHYDDCQNAIQSGEVHGGMVPKANSSFSGLRRGIRRVVIGDYSSAGDLAALLEKRKGTTLLI